ncbi:MAG: SRPBCC family protein [Methanosarcinales archaeon]
MSSFYFPSTEYIEASAERIWQILTDFSVFPQWNPFIRRASGEVKTGARLEV